MADAPEFTDTSPDPIESALITDFEDRSGRTLQDGDPVRLILESIAYAIARQRSAVQRSAEQNLVQLAEGSNLDFLAALYGLDRKAPQKATTILKFETDGNPAGSNITIPAGTRVADQDEDVLFETDKDQTLPQGDTSVTVGATATDAGAEANGFVPGQINQIVDPVAGIAAASNTEETTGGADEEPDDRFRERIQKAPETISPAGPRQAYEAAAIAAVPGIESAQVVSPSAGKVDVYVLREGGDLPTQTDLDEVELALVQEDLRPLTDTIETLEPTTVTYDIDISYVLFEEFEGSQPEIDDDVQAEVDGFVQFQREQIGRDVLPGELQNRILTVPEVKRVSITSPAFIDIARTEVARLGTRSVTFDKFETA